MTLTATSFDWVRALVHKESAIVLQPGKEYLVEARLLPIARQRGIADVSTFVDSVRSRPDNDSMRCIVEALTTNETSWFRDGDPFTALTSTVMPALLAAWSQRAAPDLVGRLLQRAGAVHDRDAAPGLGAERDDPRLDHRDRPVA
jgi:hypothetical protein